MVRVPMATTPHKTVRIDRIRSKALRLLRTTKRMAAISRVCCSVGYSRCRTNAFEA
jgi:hypothetical protein